MLLNKKITMLSVKLEPSCAALFPRSMVAMYIISTGFVAVFLYLLLQILRPPGIMLFILGQASKWKMLEAHQEHGL